MEKLRRHNKVVPKREFVIMTDSERNLLFKGISECVLRFINPVSSIDLETCFDDSIGRAVAGITNGKQRVVAPTLNDWEEETVLDEVELGTVGREVNHENLNVKFIAGVDEVLLNNQMPTGVKIAAIAEHVDDVGIGVLPLESLTLLTRNNCRGALMCHGFSLLQDA